MTLNTQESLLDLLFVGPEAFCVSGGHGVAQVDHMLEILAAVQPCTKGTFTDLEEIVLRQISFVSGCVSIFLQWDEARKGLVEQLSALAIPQIVIILKKPKQKDPQLNLKDQRYVRTLIVDSTNVQQSLNNL
jgi:hypothetical protein